MASNLNEDCLLNILENLSENPSNLYSCMRLNHNWSKIAVSILWRNHPWKYTFYSMEFWKLISHTIILSLPNHVKEFLVLNNISKPNIIERNSKYNYVSYCQLLSQNLIIKLVHCILHKYNYKTNRNYNYFNQHFLIDELWKLFLNNSQKMDYFILPDDISLVQFYNDLKYGTIFQSISKLEFSSRISSEIFIQLSHFLNDISEMIIYIYFNYPNYDNDGLSTLISSQKKLKYIKFISYDYELKKTCPNLTSSLEPISETLISLQIKEEDISFLTFNINLTNLKYLSIDLGKENVFVDKNLISLNSIKSPSLEILEIILSEIESLDSIVSLLQQTKYTLKKIKIDTNKLNIEDVAFISNYINAIIAYCPLIEDLNLWVTNDELNDVEILLESCINIKLLQLEAVTKDVNDEFLEAEPFLKLLSSKKFNNLKGIKLTGRWKFTNEELEIFLTMSEKHENFGLQIEFHSINEEKEKFKETCQKFNEKGTLRKYQFHN